MLLFKKRLGFVCYVKPTNQQPTRLEFEPPPHLKNTSVSGRNPNVFYYTYIIILAFQKFNAYLTGGIHI